MTRFLRRSVLLVALSAVAAPVAVWVGLPWPWALRWADPGATAMMLHREREARRAGDILTIRQDWVPLSEMPEHLARSVLVAEDDRFRDHRGMDWKALGEEVRYAGDADFSWSDGEDRAALRAAVRYGWEHRSELRGRSTITQQLAKNLFYGPDRSVFRKAAEVVVAARLERFLGKDRILEIYLNTVELGPGIFGVGAAAQAYFGVEANGLSRAQAASLAATLPHPLTSNPASRPGRMVWRRDLILARLSGADVIIPDPEALETPVIPLELLEPPVIGPALLEPPLITPKLLEPPLATPEIPEPTQNPGTPG
jgi:monofunctional biosynthetic peptidoglycan transglycosylase